MLIIIVVNSDIIMEMTVSAYKILLSILSLIRCIFA